MASFKAGPGSDDGARRRSYLRVYCDDGAHWKPREDDPKILPLNSEREPEDKMYEDIPNMLVGQSHPCLQGWHMGTLSQGEIALDDDDDSQRDERASLDVSTAVLFMNDTNKVILDLRFVVRSTSCVGDHGSLEARDGQGGRLRGLGHADPGHS